MKKVQSDRDRRLQGECRGVCNQAASDGGC